MPALPPDPLEVTSVEGSTVPPEELQISYVAGVSKTYESSVIGTTKLDCITIIESKFVYNYFVNDEYSKEGKASNSYTARGALPPRYNELNFSYPYKGISDIELIKNNIENIYSSEDVSNTASTTLAVQDNAVISRSFDTIQRSARIRKIDGNSTDVAMELAVSMSAGASIDLLTLQTLSANSFYGSNVYISEESNETQNRIVQSNSVPISMTVSDKFVGDVASSGEKVAIVGPVSSLSLNSEKTDKLQSSERSLEQYWSSNDYVSVLNSVETFSNPSVLSKTITAIGHLLYRKEILPDGTEDIRLLDVLDVGAKSYIDFRVKYGTSYYYWMHTVYKLTQQVFDISLSDTLASVLFQSQPSNSAYVQTIDRVPPPPPADFYLFWDYENSKLNLSWNFPVNPQQDIKYFQIFKRGSIEQPFNLVIEYDFNNSVVNPVRYENILDRNVIKMNFPFTTYTDPSFLTDSPEQIYAICSVDAHGLVSNYSQQLKCKFDRFKNKLIVERISPGNAPRQYPNMYLKGDFFLDSITRTGVKSIAVGFDPDYLNIYDARGKDINFLCTPKQNPGSYKMSVIDVQRTQNYIVTLGISQEQIGNYTANPVGTTAQTVAGAIAGPGTGTLMANPPIQGALTPGANQGLNLASNNLLDIVGNPNDFISGVPGVYRP